MNAASILTAALQLAQTPTGLQVLDDLGSFLKSLAAHNKQHLGTADAIVADAGSTLTGLAGGA